MRTVPEIHAALKPLILCMGVEFPEWNEWATFMYNTEPECAFDSDGEGVTVGWWIRGVEDTDTDTKVQKIDMRFYNILQTTFGIRIVVHFPMSVALRLDKEEL